MKYLSCLGLMVTIFWTSTLPSFAQEDPQAKTPPLIEFRRASFEAKEGWGEAEWRGNDRKIFLSPKSEITADDVKSMSVNEMEQFDAWFVSVELSDKGGAKMLSLTKEHLNQPLAILVNGEVIMAPVIKSQIGGKLSISGLNEKEAKSLVATFEKQKQN